MENVTKKDQIVVEYSDNATARIAIRTLQENIDKITGHVATNPHTQDIGALRWDLGVIMNSLVEVRQAMIDVYVALDAQIERLEERLKASNELIEAFRAGAVTGGEQDKIEQQRKTIDALKFTIEVMSKAMEGQVNLIKAKTGMSPAEIDAAIQRFNFCKGCYHSKPIPDMCPHSLKMMSDPEYCCPKAAEHPPVLFLKVTNPGEGDLAEASEVLKHWRPNFEIVKTNLRDCNKPQTPDFGPKIQMCESCGKYEAQVELKSKTHPVSYHLCHNCLAELVDLRLSPEHFKNLIRNGHKTREFPLHDDFYDEDGNALQPRGG